MRILVSAATAIAILFLAGEAGRLLVHDTRPAHPFLPVAVAAPSAPAPAAGDPAAGKAVVASSCGFCHGLTAGATMVGPTLWGVAGRPVASVAGYDYSGALKAHAGAHWTDAELDRWLTSPGAYAAGTKMYYPGLADAKSRADVIAFLHTLGPAH
jgi:cytochrome c